MSYSNKKATMVDEFKELCSSAEDIYKLSKLINEYCQQHSLCEELNDIIPITKLLYKLCDNILCDIQNISNINSNK